MMTDATISLTRPSLLDVLRAQLVLLRRSTRPVLLAAILGVVWAVVTYYVVRTGDGWPAANMLSGSWLGLMYVTGAVWGVQIWQEEGPDRRSHHWRMPVDTAVHDMVRVAAGAIWLCLAVAAFQLYGVLLMALQGELGAALAFTPLLWLSYYTAALLGYLLMSIFTTLFNRGFEWSLLFGGAVFVAWFELGTSGESYPEWLRPVGRFLDAVMGGSLGFTSALSGMATIASERAGVPVASLATPDSPQVWVLAILTWLTAASAAVFAAAYWHRRQKG